MKIILFLFALVMLCSCESQVKQTVKIRKEPKVVTGVGIERLDNRYGLEEFEFETSPEEYENIEFDKDMSFSSDWKYYRKSSFVDLGFMSSDSILYTFYKDKLYHISVYGHAYNKLEFYSALVEIYGKPTFNNRFGSTWKGKKVEMEVEEVVNNNNRGLSLGGDDNDFNLELKSLFIDSLIQQDKDKQYEDDKNKMKRIL